MHVRERKINATAFVAILAAAWASVVPARVRAATFVKDVMLIGGRSLDMPALRVQYTSSGWTAVNSDLNEGTDGDRIYLLYKTAEHPGETAEFITGFYIDTVSTTNPPATHTVDGTTYHLVDFDGSDNFKNSKGDLNRGAGGDYIHLYYTKSVLPSGRAVASIEFNDTQSGAVAANGGNAPGYDLNKGCGSESAYIYMHLATEIFEYAIAYDLAGGSLPSGTSNPSSYNVETATFTLNEPSRPGYAFAGWTWQGMWTAVRAARPVSPSPAGPTIPTRRRSPSTCGSKSVRATAPRPAVKRPLSPTSQATPRTAAATSPDGMDSPPLSRTSPPARTP